MFQALIRTPGAQLRAAFFPLLATLLPATLLPATLRAQEASAETEPAAAADLPLPEGAPAALGHIDQAGLRAHAFHFASDELGGRYTASAGQLAAAEYVAAHFAQLGLEPLGDEVDGERTWVQRYPVVKTHVVEETARVVLGGETFGHGFGVLDGSAVHAVDVRGRLVWCGYGKPDDLAAFESADDVPVVAVRVKGGAGVNVNAQFMLGLVAMRKATSIAEKLVARGAKVVLFAVLDDEGGLGEMLNYAGLLPGKPLLRFGNDAGMAQMVEQMKAEVPVVFLSSRLSRAALASLGIDAAAEGDLGAPTVTDAEAAVSLTVEVDAGATAVNVVGLLRGSDPELAAEAVVFSSHMDHMGTRFDGDVFNGADDNASGSAAMLEVAEAFAKGERPRRSVIFLSVSGEELGLWGSQHYAKHPTWPLANLVANINIDMIGRAADLSGPNEISITPSHSHQKYSSIGRTSARLAESVGLGLTDGDMFYTRSDHYNFAVRGIPVVFYCDGEHADYHQVTDTPDKLDYAKIQKVARLAAWTGLEIANDDARPTEIGRQPDWLPGDGGDDRR